MVLCIWILHLAKKRLPSLSLPAGRISPFSFHSIRHCGSTAAAAIATMYYSAHWIPLLPSPSPSSSPPYRCSFFFRYATLPFPSTHVFVTINDIGDGKEGRGGGEMGVARPTDWNWMMSCCSVPRMGGKCDAHCEGGSHQNVGGIGAAPWDNNSKATMLKKATGLPKALNKHAYVVISSKVHVWGNPLCNRIGLNIILR